MLFITYFFIKLYFYDTRNFHYNKMRIKLFNAYIGTSQNIGSQFKITSATDGSIQYRYPTLKYSAKFLSLLFQGDKYFFKTQLK